MKDTPQWVMIKMNFIQTRQQGIQNKNGRWHVQSWNQAHD